MCACVGVRARSPPSHDSLTSDGAPAVDSPTWWGVTPVWTSNSTGNSTSTSTRTRTSTQHRQQQQQQQQHEKSLGQSISQVVSWLSVSQAASQSVNQSVWLGMERVREENKAGAAAGIGASHISSDKIQSGSSGRATGAGRMAYLARVAPVVHHKVRHRQGKGQFLIPLRGLLPGGWLQKEDTESRRAPLPTAKLRDRVSETRKIRHTPVGRTLPRDGSGIRDSRP